MYIDITRVHITRTHVRTYTQRYREICKYEYAMIINILFL